jgi:transmembrane sensor
MISSDEPFELYEIDLLVRYAQGSCSADERNRIELAMAASPALTQRIVAMQAAQWDGAHKLSVVWAAIRKAEGGGVVVERSQGLSRRFLGMRGVPKLSSLGQRALRRVSPWVGGIAAVLVLTLSIGGHGPSIAPTVYSTQAAEQRTIQLTDGTRVVLAPQSRLTIPSDFYATTRTVSLSGEAYFDVTQSSGHPFLVQTGRVSARVLGTTFDIRHYYGDAGVQIAVQSGKVAVQGHGAPFTVSGGNMARVTDSTVIVETLGDSNSYADWTTGRLVFDETPLPVMLATLERWYGYEFQLHDSALVSQHVSAVFKVSDPSDMMIVLKGILGVTLTFHGNVIMLTPRHDIYRARSRLDVFTPRLEIGK